MDAKDMMLSDAIETAIYEARWKIKYRNMAVMLACTNIVTIAMLIFVMIGG